MERVCLMLQVRRNKLEEYRKVHEQVWPEMLAALRRHGWHNYSLFLREDGLLIGYLETPDFGKALAGMQQEEVNARWQKSVAHLFEPLDSGAADTSFLRIAEVFHLP
jgi:L-rhamnose mutarotase